MISSIMPMPKNPLCSNTGKRITKVDRVLLLVCAKLSTWMATQGTLPIAPLSEKKPSQNSSSCFFYEEKGNSEEETTTKRSPPGSCSPRDKFHQNDFLIISGWRRSAY